MSDAIAFDQYVNNATKGDPSLTKDNLEEFQVWGYMTDNTGTVFTGDLVYKSGSAWAYDNTQYWAPGKDYWFEAVAPVGGSWEVVKATDADITALNFENHGDQDLIYTCQKVDARTKQQLTNGVAPVQLQFAHLLSKVQFTFKNGFPGENVTVRVSDVTMTAPAKATVNLDDKSWSNYDGSTTLSFNNVSADMTGANASGVAEEQRLTIPADENQVYTVKFTVDVLYGDETALSAQEVTSTISGYALEAGHAYNFQAAIGPEVFDMQPIEFTVVGVDEWDSYNGNAADGKAVATVEELKAALANGGHYALVADLTLDADETLKVEAGKVVALDLYSHSIVAESDQTGANRNLFDVRGSLSITNTSNALTRNATGGVISVKHVGSNMGWSNCVNVFYVGFKGTLNLDGVTAKNEGGSDMAYVIDMCNAQDATINVKNSTLESTYIPVRLFNNTNGLHNATIKNSTLKGKYCFWVQYHLADGRTEETLKNSLNINIFNNEQNSNNTFVNSAKAPILYGFNNPVYYNADGTIPVFELNAEGQEVAVDGAGILEVSLETNENGEEVKKYVYGLSNANGLKWVANKLSNVAPAAEGEPVYEVNGNTVKLLADIDLYESDENGEAVCFRPIGNYRQDVAFTGTFDGQGHTIKNLNQNTWALDFGYYYGSGLGLGLFSCVENATIKNLKIDKANISGESALCGIVAATAYGDCTFENITVTNSNCADYQYYAGGIVGWASGNHKYINCNVDASTTVGGQWGDFANSNGGIIGGAGKSAEIYMKDCNVACRIDAVNDVVSTYHYYAYRCCGMLIGNTNSKQEIDGTPYAAAPNLTCENVTVTYGDWMNYHYCAFGDGKYAYVRVEDGVSVDAYVNIRYGHPTDANGNTVVDDNHAHNDGEDHHICLPFDQLLGGGPNGDGRSPVYGLPSFPGVTVVYPASYNPEN